MGFPLCILKGFSSFRTKSFEAFFCGSNAETPDESPSTFASAAKSTSQFVLEANLPVFLLTNRHLAPFLAVVLLGIFFTQFPSTLDLQPSLVSVFSQYMFAIAA